MKWVFAFLAGIGILSASLALGYVWRDVSNGRAPDFHSLPAVFGNAPKKREITPTLAFRQTLGEIETQFYGTVERKQLTYAAVDGMIAALNDPHTLLMEPSQAKLFQEKNQGQFVGIGAELTRDVMGARVRRVFKNSPALEAGLLAGDVITRVGNREVTSYKSDLNAVVADIRGEEGTYVNLTVYRESERRSLSFRVIRRPVRIQDVYGEVITEGTKRIGRLEVRSFQETIIDQFDQELTDLEKKRIDALIIDLRGNPGGLLSAAVDMSSRFLDQKLIATMRRRDGRTETFVSRAGATKGRLYPIVVLIDEGSASASEIFAGAMQDWRRATLVGEHTYGKGSVQVVRPLRDGAQLKITIAKYYLPNGESIQRRESEFGEYLSGGVKPDVEVKRDPAAVPGDDRNDKQLNKAIEVLLEQLR